MRHIVVSVTTSEGSSRKWIILELIVDLVHMYVFFCGDKIDVGVQKNMDDMVYYQDNSEIVQILCRNLVEMQFKIH